MPHKRMTFSTATDANGVPVTASCEGAAQWLGVTGRTVTNMCRDGRAVGSLVGGTWRVNLPETLRRFGLYPYPNSKDGADDQGRR